MKPYRIRRVAETASTNDDAIKAAEAGEAEGLVIHALKQTAGRGRHGRAWESPEGNLYCSVLLRPSCEPKNYGQYSFVAALALFEVVAGCLATGKPLSPLGGERGWGEGGDDVMKSASPLTRSLREHPLPPEGGEGYRGTLKWPNDVLVDGKKIAGILLESGEGFLVVGMGLNILHHPKDALYSSTSLHASGAASSDLDAILKKLLSRLSHWYDVMQSENFPPIRAAWLERAQKGRMTVKMPGETLEGDFVDLDEQGHLRLRLSDGTKRVLATGDVFLRAR